MWDSNKMAVLILIYKIYNIEYAVITMLYAYKLYEIKII